jgi:hypothetical protein
MRAIGFGGRNQILRLQLSLKRNGIPVQINGQVTSTLTDGVRMCFGGDACRTGLATAL